MIDDSTRLSHRNHEKVDCEAGEKGQAGPSPANPAVHETGSVVPHGENPPFYINRGVVIAIDYFLIICHGLQHAVFQRIYSQTLLNDQNPPDSLGIGRFFMRSEHSGRGYQAIFNGKDQSTIYTHPYGKSDHLHIEFKGVTCARYSFQQLREFVKQLNKHSERINLTRADVAIDHTSISPEYLHLAHNEQRVVTKSRSFRFFDESSGQTIYFGAKTSQRTLCVYNKRGLTE